MWGFSPTISADGDVYFWDEDLFSQLGALLVPAKV
jgi:hypothetical protein